MYSYCKSHESIKLYLTEHFLAFLCCFVSLYTLLGIFGSRELTVSSFWLDWLEHETPVFVLNPCISLCFTVVNHESLNLAVEILWVKNKLCHSLYLIINVYFTNFAASNLEMFILPILLPQIWAWYNLLKLRPSC